MNLSGNNYGKFKFLDIEKMSFCTIIEAYNEWYINSPPTSDTKNS